MDIDIKRKTEGNFLVITTAEMPRSDFETRILSSCPIPGFLPFRKEIVDEKCSYLYNISSMISLEAYTETENVSSGSIKTILINILNSVSALREYMVSEDHIIFTPSCIFISPGDLKTALCCHPDYDGDFASSFIKLMEYMTDHIYRYDRESAMLVFRILKAASSGNRSVEDLKEILYRDAGDEGAPKDAVNDRQYDRLAGTPDEYEADGPDDLCEDTEIPEAASSKPREISKKIKTMLLLFLTASAITLVIIAVRYGFIPASPETVLGTAAGLAALIVFILIKRRKAPATETKEQQIPQQTDCDSEEDELAVLIKEEESATMLVSDIPRGHAMLKPLDSAYPSAAVGIKPVVIGKSRDLCDLVIQSPVISRMHARIYREGSVFYIQDLNSKNGTFLNDKALSGRESAGLCGGDIIRFANICYSFDFISE